MSSYRIVIADDHPLFRDALKHALQDTLRDLEVAEAGSFDGVVRILDQDDAYDLILLDLKMPGVQGFSGLMYLRAQFASIPVVIVSASDDTQVIRTSLDFGASGFIPKSASIAEIRTAITEILNGAIWTPPDIDLTGSQDSESARLAAKLSTLTPQQVRVLMMLGEGLLNKQIAFKLSVSEATIKAHVSAILQKLAVDSRTQAVIAINRLANGTWKKVVT
jgi:DNA-binding NarL/FixJ family response regulator